MRGGEEFFPLQPDICFSSGAALYILSPKCTFFAWCNSFNLHFQAWSIQPPRDQWQGAITHWFGKTTSCCHSCQVLNRNPSWNKSRITSEIVFLSIIIAGSQRFLFPTPTLLTQTWQGNWQSACDVGTKENFLVCDICRAIETAEIVAEALPNTPVLPVWRNGLLKDPLHSNKRFDNSFLGGYNSKRGCPNPTRAKCIFFKKCLIDLLCTELTVSQWQGG